MNCTENIVRYCNVNETQIFNTLNDKAALSLIHTNICSLLKNIKEVQYPTEKTKIRFNVIAITKPKIT